jgi:hypothetical protein
VRILEGLDAVKIRRLTLKLYKEQLYARTSNVLAWLPGFEGDEVWAAHTEVVYRQRKAEELTILKDGDAREREIA